MVNVKKRSIESRSTNRLMANHAKSVRIVCVSSLVLPSIPFTKPRTTKHHDRYDMPRPLREAKFDGGTPCEGDHGDSREGEEDSHGAVGDMVGIDGAGGVVEGAVEAGEGAGEADEHLAERGVHLIVKTSGQPSYGRLPSPICLRTSKKKVRLR